MLEAGRCGHGPSGRNGGFVSTLWDDLTILRERVGDARAVDVCRASERAVRGIGAWCEAQNVEAWYRAAPQLEVATSEAQLGSWDEALRAERAVGGDETTALDRDAVRAVCDSPLFLGGTARRTAATVQPARLALGLRRRVE